MIILILTVLVNTGFRSCLNTEIWYIWVSKLILDLECWSCPFVFVGFLILSTMNLCLLWLCNFFYIPYEMVWDMWFAIYSACCNNSKIALWKLMFFIITYGDCFWLVQGKLNEAYESFSEAFTILQQVIHLEEATLMMKCTNYLSL